MLNALGTRRTNWPLPWHTGNIAIRPNPLPTYRNTYRTAPPPLLACRNSSLWKRLTYQPLHWHVTKATWEQTQLTRTPITKWEVLSPAIKGERMVKHIHPCRHACVVHKLLYCMAGWTCECVVCAQSLKWNDTEVPCTHTWLLAGLTHSLAIIKLTSSFYAIIIVF